MSTKPYLCRYETYITRFQPWKQLIWSLLAKEGRDENWGILNICASQHPPDFYLRARDWCPKNNTQSFNHFLVVRVSETRGSREWSGKVILTKIWLTVQWISDLYVSQMKILMNNSSFNSIVSLELIWEQHSFAFEIVFLVRSCIFKKI